MSHTSTACIHHTLYHYFVQSKGLFVEIRQSSIVHIHYMLISATRSAALSRQIQHWQKLKSAVNSTQPSMRCVPLSFFLPLHSTNSLHQKSAHTDHLKPLFSLGTLSSSSTSTPPPCSVSLEWRPASAAHTNQRQSKAWRGCEIGSIHTRREECYWILVEGSIGNTVPRHASVASVLSAARTAIEQGRNPLQDCKARMTRKQQAC